MFLFKCIPPLLRKYFILWKQLRSSGQYDRYTENSQYNQASPRAPIPFLLKECVKRGGIHSPSAICFVVFTSVHIITERVCFFKFNEQLLLFGFFKLYYSLFPQHIHVIKIYIDYMLKCTKFSSRVLCTGSSGHLKAEMNNIPVFMILI